MVLGPRRLFRLAAGLALAALAAHGVLAAELTPFTVNANGNTLACLKAGSGPAAVIVHGLGGHKEDFKDIILGLSNRHTAYACDMLGFGQSSRKAASVGIGAQADALKALLDAEQAGKADVIGNSLGGWVAATFAIRYPGRTSKLVMIDTAGLKVTLSGPPPVNFAPEKVDEMQKLLQTVIASDFAHSRDFAEKALADFKASGEAATLASLFAGFASPDNKDPFLDDVLPEIKAPTLVIWGAKDGLFPVALADIVTAGVPGSTKTVIANASHFPQIDDPKALTAAIETFLE